MHDSDIKKLLDARISRARAKELLIALVRVPSPQTEQLEDEPLLKAFITSAIEPRLRTMGFVDIRYDGMGNLIAAYGAGTSNKSLMFIGNAMNQPASTMPNPYDGDVVDGAAYGLPGECVMGKGASEQKANLAAMLHAMETVIASEVTITGKLIFTCCLSGETGKHDAIKSVVEGAGVRADMAVLGGTGLKITLGNRGRIDVFVTVKGAPCHSSRPWDGVNAITGATEAIRLLLAKVKVDKRHPQLGRQSLTVNHIRSFPDSTHTVQERCEFTLDRRTLPGDDPNEAFAEIERIAKEVERIEDPVSGKTYGVEVRLGPFMYPSLVRTATGCNAASPGVTLRRPSRQKTLVRSGIYRHLSVIWRNPVSSRVIRRGATTVLPRRQRRIHRYHALPRKRGPMKRALSDRLLRSLARPRTAPQEIWDQQLRGFGCRASKQGVVSFFAMRRPRGSAKSIRIKVGDFPAMSLVDARQRARALLTEMQDGGDPRARKAEETRLAAVERASTFGTVAEAFITRHVASKRAAREIERLVRRELISRWGERPIASIARAEVIAMIDEIVDRGHPEAARQTLTYLRRLFGWAVPRYDLQSAPTDHLKGKDLIGAKKPRQRVLSDSEIALIWRATEGPEAAYYGPFIRLLLLLGARRSELGRAPWSEFDLDAALWTIPPGRMKSDESHAVLLPPAAVEILRAPPQGKGYVLNGAQIHYVRAKDRLDARMTRLNGGKAIPHWTLHDLRRTFRTGLSRLSIAPHIAELCIGHRQQGLHRIYDLHKFDAEKRHAFEAWAAHVKRVVAPPEGRVVPLRPAR